MIDFIEDVAFCDRVTEHQPVGHVLSVNSESFLVFDAFGSTEMLMVNRVQADFVL